MQVPMPTSLIPKDDQVFITDQRGIRSPNAEFLKQHFLQEGRLTDTQALYILDQATQLLASEPNLVDVESPVTSKSY
jgi:serine/threonine-protein phosphatase 2B catalytic subunit